MPRSAYRLNARTDSTTVYLEPMLLSLMEMYLEQVHITKSSFIRSLLIEKFRSVGMMTEDQLAQLSS